MGRKPFDRLLMLVVTTAALIVCGCGSSSSPSSLSLSAPTAATPVAMSYSISGMPSVLMAGDQATLRAERVLNDGSTASVTGATWSSSNSEVATVDSTGQLIARRSGTVDVTFSIGDQRSISATARVVPNISGTYRITWTVTSCTGWNCLNINSGFSDVTLSQTGDAVTSKGIDALWGNQLRGTLATDGTLTVQSYYCREMDSTFGSDGRFEEMRLLPEDGGLAGTSNFTFRFGLAGPCNALTVDPAKIATGTQFVRVARR
jgi:hypothetical protein